MQIFKPNMDFFKQEAERINSQKSENGLPPLNWYEWKKNNTLRILPAFNSRGFWFKKVSKHYNVVPKNSSVPCYLATWPGESDYCPQCDEMEKIQRKFPEADLSRMNPGSYYYVNAIDRDNEDAGVFIVRLTPKVYNWLVIQVTNPKIGDITDYENGVDITIDVNEKPRKDGKKYVDYKTGMIPNRGPIFDNDDKMAATLDNLPDLDKIFKFPSDEKIVEHTKISKAMSSFLLKKYKDGFTGEADAENESEGETYVPPKRDEKKVESGEASEGVEKSVNNSKSESLESHSPRDMPACFAGQKDPEKLPDGSIGFNESLDKCQICPHELRCADVKSSKGL